VSGIFDIKWLYEASLPVLALALSDGTVQRVVLNSLCDDVSMDSHAAILVTSSAMVLSLDVSGTGAPCLAASTSAGGLATVQVSSSCSGSMPRNC